MTEKKVKTTKANASEVEKNSEKSKTSKAKSPVKTVAEKKPHIEKKVETSSPVKAKKVDIKKDDKKSPKSKSISKKGSRKRSIAAARMVDSNSFVITVNGKNYLEYFTKKADQIKALYPVSILGDMVSNLSFFVKVYGGGTTGQSVACANAIAKCIVENFKENEDIRRILRKAKCLTRDPRKVEKKKAGLRKARKREQWSKR